MSAEQMERMRRELAGCPPLSRVVPSDLLPIPEPLQSALHLAYRQGGISVDELAGILELDTSEARDLAGELVEKGYLQASPLEKADVYIARFSGRITRPGGSPLDKI